MKKLISIILSCTLVLGMMLTLVSCGGGLSGTYEGDNLITVFDLKFKGNKVTVIIGDNDALTGTYKIEKDGDKKTITFDFVDEKDASEEEKKSLEVIDKLLGASVAFEEDGKTIWIAKIFKFTKK